MRSRKQEVQEYVDTILLVQNKCSNIYIWAAKLDWFHSETS